MNYAIEMPAFISRKNKGVLHHDIRWHASLFSFVIVKVKGRLPITECKEKLAIFAGIGF